MTQYRLLPEWSEQSAILITWPHEHTSWGCELRNIENVFIDMTCAITSHQTLIINCYNEKHRTHIQQLLENAKISLEKIHLHIIPSNDIWTRDYSPLSVKDQNENVYLLNFRFNGWGEKYSYDCDDRATTLLEQQNAFDDLIMIHHDFILEGGSLEVDDYGTLLTTESCLLNPARNPSYSRDQIENVLKNYLGIERILWLKHSYLAGDDTDGHIDMLARFVNSETIVYTACDDPHDEHFETCQQMARELKTFRSYRNHPYHLIPLPIPKPKYDRDGKRLPASYANFLIMNDCVLVPIYEDLQDKYVIETLDALWPHRKIIPINANALIEQYGSIHCATMQIAASK